MKTAGAVIAVLLLADSARAEIRPPDHAQIDFIHRDGFELITEKPCQVHLFHDRRTVKAVLVLVRKRKADLTRLTPMGGARWV